MIAKQRRNSIDAPHDNSGTPLQPNVAHPVRLSYRVLGAGLAGASISAFATAGLLLVNGSITLIVLNSFIVDGPEWLQRPSLMQFILFCVPLAMVVLQWMIWDTIVDRLLRPAR